MHNLVTAKRVDNLATAEPIEEQGIAIRAIEIPICSIDTITTTTSISVPPTGTIINGVTNIDRGVVSPGTTNTSTVNSAVPESTSGITTQDEKLLTNIFTLCWFLVVISGIIFMGFIISLFLVLVFNVDWLIFEKSVGEQIGVFFGIGIAITVVFIMCYFITKIENN